MIRVLAVLLAGLCLAALAGLVGQTLAEAADPRRYPPPGRLVDIGGRRLHLRCAGPARDASTGDASTGPAASAPTGPTVVIEAGSGNDSTLWEDMLRRVAGFARVCVYDRAGLGWSDPAPGPQSFDDRAADLRVLLQRARVAGPYVLVGHSYGGYIVRRFAAADPGEVAGVVLVDAPDELFSFDPYGLRDAAGIGAGERRMGWMVRLGLLRLGIALFPERLDPMKGVPPEMHGQMTALFLRGARHVAVADEMAAYDRVPADRRGAGGFGRLGALPLAVVSRGARDPATGAETFPEWQQAQARLATLSSNSLRITADRSGHMIQFSQPGRIVEAIRHVLAEAARAQG